MIGNASLGRRNHERLSGLLAEGGRIAGKRLDVIAGPRDGDADQKRVGRWIFGDDGKNIAKQATVGQQRRRQIDPTTCERDYSEEEIAFMKAMDQYKRDNRRPFPTWSEVLEVLRALGYRKIAEPTVLPGLQPNQPRREDE